MYGTEVFEQDNGGIYRQIVTCHANFKDDLNGERRGIPSVLHPIEWEIWKRIELTVFGDRKIRKLGEA